MRKLLFWAVTGIVKRRHAALCRRVAARRLAMSPADGTRIPQLSHTPVIASAKTVAEHRDAGLPWDHAPDFVIGTREDPYLYRWFIVDNQGGWPLGFLKKWFPKSKAAKAVADFFAVNIYLHRFMRSDEDVLHDHPWDNMSILLEGSYMEHVFQHKPRGPAEGWEYEVPETMIRVHVAGGYGGIAFRKAATAHRVELYRDKHGKEMPVWSLFITTRKKRSWGFWCPKAWRHWEKFVAGGRQTYVDGESVRGNGCE